MFNWNFSQLYKEGSWALRGKVFLWVKFLLFPTAILDVQRDGGGWEARLSYADLKNN